MIYLVLMIGGYLDVGSINAYSLLVCGGKFEHPGNVATEGSVLQCVAVCSV